MKNKSCDLDISEAQGSVQLGGRGPKGVRAVQHVLSPGEFRLCE